MPCRRSVPASHGSGSASRPSTRTIEPISAATGSRDRTRTRPAPAWSSNEKPGPSGRGAVVTAPSTVDAGAGRAAQRACVDRRDPQRAHPQHRRDAGRDEREPAAIGKGTTG